MPYTKIRVHLVWATKCREPLLSKKIRQHVFKHIEENAKKKGIQIDEINGHEDHAHVLLSMHANQSIAEIAQLIKGESSYWINKNNLIPGKFEWQDDYFAVSVSEADVNRVREYIRNQETHHTHKTFHEEYTALMKEYESAFSGG